MEASLSGGSSSSRNKAQARARKSVAKQLGREQKQKTKAFSKLTERVFACRQDAEGALAAFAETLKATTTDAVEILACEHVELRQQGRASEGG